MLGYPGVALATLRNVENEAQRMRQDRAGQIWPKVNGTVRQGTTAVVVFRRSEQAAAL